MRVPQLVLIAAVSAVTLASVAAAVPNVAKQHVRITASGHVNPTSFGQVVLSPIQAGAIKRDSGTITATWSSRVVTREGQRIEISTSVSTLKGKRGTLVFSERVEWVETGGGYHVGIGTWKVTSGTGQYAKVAGGGRSGNVWNDSGDLRWYTSYAGFLAAP